jgi:hypothetical protein
MKKFNVTSMLLQAALAIFLISCGGGDEKSTNDATSTETASTTVNTIVTTPQAMVIVIHKVADYAKWKSGYDAHDSARLANGLHNYVIGRGLNDSNTVLVALKADDMAKAKAFAQSPDLKTVMQKAGVVGQPTMNFLTATWQDTSDVGAIPRSLTTFSVKDWDAWVKNFEEGKQERTDNGIVARVISHDADDNKKVALVTAVTDTTKAFAFYKSDALKKRREAGGVIGEPQRFLFTIAARYR